MPAGWAGLQDALELFGNAKLALDDWIEEHVAENELPMLLFLAGADRIIDNAGVLELLTRAEEPGLEVITYPDETHSIQFDRPEQLVEDMNHWLSRQPRRREDARP